MLYKSGSNTAFLLLPRLQYQVDGSILIVVLRLLTMWIVDCDYFGDHLRLWCQQGSAWWWQAADHRRGGHLRSALQTNYFRFLCVAISHDVRPGASSPCLATCPHVNTGLHTWSPHFRHLQLASPASCWFFPPNWWVQCPVSSLFRWMGLWREKNGDRDSREGHFLTDWTSFEFGPSPLEVVDMVSFPDRMCWIFKLNLPPTVWEWKVIRK